MRQYWTWSFVLACGAKDPPPCQQWTLNERSTGVTIALSRPDEPDIEVEAVIPRSGRAEDGAATAIFVHGGWSPVQLPLGEGSPTLREDMGFTTLYPNLGRNDARGEPSRAILARVLQYANGDFADTSDCTLDERIPVGRAPQVILAGFSNGGNLAWATAGDAAQDIPRLDGIATFETPLSSQFITGEPGTDRHPNPRFEADSCDFDSTDSVNCALNYAPLLSMPVSECSETAHCLFIDIDESESLTEGDVQLGGAWDSQHEATVYSVAATRAAEQAGILPEATRSSEEALVFWEHREAPKAMRSAAHRFPDLAGIATGTEVDHVLNDLERAIHVTGMVHAMEKYGVRWARLHPDPKYLIELHGSDPNWIDNPPNIGVRIEDAEWPMEPEDGPSIRGTDYLSAAVAEIIDRSRTGDWAVER
jgi:pimeloyl-ACP methyl ester carboxylesterase